MQDVLSRIVFIQNLSRFIIKTPSIVPGHYVEQYFNDNDQTKTYFYEIYLFCFKSFRRVFLFTQVNVRKGCC